MALEVWAQYGLEIRANMAFKIRVNLVRKSGAIWLANPGQYGLEIRANFDWKTRPILPGILDRLINILLL